MEQYLEKTTLKSYLKDTTQLNTPVEVTEQIKQWFTNDFKSYYDSDDKFYIYTIPKLGEGGTCSLKHETESFNLSTIVGEPNQQLSNILSRLYHITSLAQQLTKVDWIGIYRVYNVNGEKSLTKLAYQGEISRPLFPLNEYWTTISNNSFVGLNGKGRIIQSLETYDGPYYNCSDKVKSEVCIPIFDTTGQNVIGIIDAESWKDLHFNDKEILELSQLAVQLSELLTNPVLNF